MSEDLRPQEPTTSQTAAASGTTNEAEPTIVPSLQCTSDDEENMEDEDYGATIYEDEDGSKYDPRIAPFEFKEQDRLLPYANIERIMKKTVELFNKNAKISKEAKECMQECVTEFICFVTGEASEQCYEEKRKTVGGEDVLAALEKLGFENYGKFQSQSDCLIISVPPLTECLQKHREFIKTDKRVSTSSTKPKKKPKVPKLKN